MIYVLGDSFSNPGYGATSGHGYVDVLRQLMGNPPVTNFGIAGGMTADQTTHLCSIAISGADESIVELGTNDHWNYKNDPVKMEYFAAGIQSVIAYLATPAKTLGKNVLLSDLTGVWNNTASFGIGKMASQIGSTLKFRASGKTVYLGGIQFDGISGAFSVAIDGADKGAFQVNAPGMTTTSGMPCGQRLYRFPDLSDCDHDVLITMTGGQYIYAEWCAGSDQAEKPPVYVCALTKMTPACYASRSPLSDATLAQYNAILRQAVDQFRADGMNVAFVESSAVFFPDCDTFSDGLHPNDTGHAKIAMNLLGAMAC